MICDRNIVCVASNWSDHPTSKHHVMRILAERNNVLWVNFHASRRPQLNTRDTRLMLQRLRQARAGTRRVAPNIDVLSPLLLPFPESRVARCFNQRALVRQIKAALRRLPDRPLQLWLFTPDVPELIHLLPTERVVYYCVDDFAAFSGFNEALIARLELRTIRASDLVITTSASLYEQRRALHTNTHLVPHGVDFEHFASAPELPTAAAPEDIRRVTRPVLGYFGLISDYVDLELLSQAARRKPEWSFVLVGDVRRDVSVIAGLPNVHLLGGRPYEQLPAYCRCFDVGLIPFSMNRLTRAVNPIKLREYLAAGLPVVSSPLPAVLAYRPAVQVAETLDEFIAACESALTAAATEHYSARQALVRGESWRARVELLAGLTPKQA
ncbi:MAG: glycosyltransferase [Planctomycetes bacterium]|nr:glycosyltransferase [Planctomycetota bacterium]